MKTVLTYGTFDLFHVGHVKLLKRLAGLGDKLIVGLSTDEFNALKGKKSVYSYEERKEILESCKYVDQVFPEDNWQQKRSDIEKYKVDIFGMGHDWTGKFDELKDSCDVVYLDRTAHISTTFIKSQMRQLDTAHIVELEEKMHNALEILKTISNTIEASEK